MTNRAEMQRLLDAYVAAYRSGDADGCAACFTEDAQLFSPYSQPARGRAAIANLHADWVQEGENKRMTLLDCGAEGALAWALCRYDEGRATGSGTSLFVCERSTDAAWRIRICSLNEDDPG
jgi:ketosteroid isomerase-like protein